MKAPVSITFDEALKTGHFLLCGEICLTLVFDTLHRCGHGAG